ncbi:outer membrane protein assembly factor BamE [Azoarcus sp. TTM-91]|uniref:outer membrane protein assembly factor BamE domain-containing protein n=1 Tax=Azoarcus sp. TTM-91 TaxID=2691581 RepID=UPI00145F65A9|nr:outer membrane protein assembly factor BamE [Azoarcus sp. TTM-91]NMG35672.1 outer membrane protein assembly factor BamE [Azoarcus sp. TTM-91]
MKRLLLILCSLLAAIGLPACDYFAVRDLKPGVSTVAEVKARLGEPQAVWPNADGSSTWEYSRQPQGAECYMATMGADGVLLRLEQVLNEANFARVESGMRQEQVLRLLGRPASRQHFALKRETVWEWLIDRGDADAPRYFTVSFGEDGLVRGSGRYSRPRG